MKSAFHYLLKVKLVKLISPLEIDFVEFEERIDGENPIEARDKAFELYRNYVTVLLNAKNKEYITDRQAAADLKCFAEPGTKTKIRFAGKDIEFDDTVGNGLGVFWVVDKPIDNYIVEDHIGDEFLIHGIGGMGWANDPKSMMSSLVHEYWYHEKTGTDCRHLKKTISFYEYDIAQAEPNIILATPFDWTGYNKPYSAMYQADTFTPAEQVFLESLVRNGEISQVEFKPSLLFNHKTGKGGISIKGIIAKTICAFLNSNGGILFIGITNRGDIQGLDFDYSLANGKAVRDFFQLEYDQMLEHFLSISVKSNVSGQFFEMDGKELFAVTVLPSKHRPIFLNGQEGKQFYVRTDTSSRHLSDIEEIANYCIDTWTA